MHLNFFSNETSQETFPLLCDRERMKCTCLVTCGHNLILRAFINIHFLFVISPSRQKNDMWIYRDGKANRNSHMFVNYTFHYKLFLYLQNRCLVAVSVIVLSCMT